MKGCQTGDCISAVYLNARILGLGSGALRVAMDLPFGRCSIRSGTAGMSSYPPCRRRSDAANLEKERRTGPLLQRDYEIVRARGVSLYMSCAPCTIDAL